MMARTTGLQDNPVSPDMIAWRQSRPPGGQLTRLSAIQGELDLAAGGHDGNSGLGWLGLVGVLSLRIGSFQGGSYFLIKGKATSL
jgi:hypothetical protein